MTYRAFKILFTAIVWFYGLVWLSAPGGVIEVAPQPIVESTPVTQDVVTTWAADPRCDGGECAGSVDTSRDTVACPTPAGDDYRSGARQTGEECPEPYAVDDPHFVCPTDAERADLVNLDSIAAAEGCGPTIWQETP